MKSNLPKVLHPVAGKTMLSRVIDIVRRTGIENICLILGKDQEPFRIFLGSEPDLNVVIQEIPNGTGGALACARFSFEGTKDLSYAPGSLARGTPFTSHYLLVCYGDTPALNPQTLQDFLGCCMSEEARLSVLGMNHPRPFGYGRILANDDHRVLEIIEERDADEETRKINICNTGVVFAEVAFMFKLLAQLRAENNQKEFLLTDCFKIAAQRGEPAHLTVTDNYQQFDGVNNLEQLANMEQYLQLSNA